MLASERITIESLPWSVIYENILPKLCACDQRIAELLFRAFRKPCQEFRRDLARRICRVPALTKQLSSYGSTSLRDLDSQKEIAHFLSQTVRCIEKVNNTLPQHVRSTVSARDLVDACDLERIEKILKDGSQFTLGKKLSRELKCVAVDASTGLLPTLCFGAWGLCVGSTLDWKTIHIRVPIPIGRAIAPSVGVGTGLYKLFLDHDLPGPTRVCSALLGVTVGMLVGQASEMGQTAAQSIATTLAIVVIFSVVFGMVERRLR